LPYYVETSDGFEACICAALKTRQCIGLGHIQAAVTAHLNHRTINVNSASE
jgi:hypothetical protein